MRFFEPLTISVAHRLAPGAPELPVSSCWRALELFFTRPEASHIQACDCHEVVAIPRTSEDSRVPSLLSIPSCCRCPMVPHPIVVVPGIGCSALLGPNHGLSLDDRFFFSLKYFRKTTGEGQRAPTRRRKGSNNGSREFSQFIRLPWPPGNYGPERLSELPKETLPLCLLLLP